MEVSKRAVKNMQKKKGTYEEKRLSVYSRLCLSNSYRALHNYQGLPGARGDKGDKGEAGERVSFFAFNVHDINSQVRFRTGRKRGGKIAKVVIRTVMLSVAIG